MAKNPIYDQALTRQGVQYTYEEKVRLDQIDLGKGLKNQARLEEPLDEELVQQYVAEKKDGCEFPGVILWKPPRGRYVPMDGNHRLAADVKLGKSFVDAYVVHSEDPAVIDRITWSINNHLNGRRLTYEECMRHAITLVRMHGIQQRVAAKEYGIPATSLSSRLKALEVREAAERQGVVLNPTFTDDKAMTLGVLLPMGEDVLAKAARVVNDTGILTRDTEELVRSVKRGRTHEEKLAAVDAFAAQDKVQQVRAASKGGKVNPVVRPAAKLLAILRQAERMFEDYPDAKSLRPLASEMKEAREVAGNVRMNLTRLYGLGVVEPSAEVG